MINFYNNLEIDDPAIDNEIDSASLERVFFIKPTHEINVRLQKSESATGLNLHQKISSCEQKPAKAAVPRIPMERLNQKVESPKILENEDDFVTNPVLVGAMHQTSKFDNYYEDDYEGANITLDMQTSRLA